MQKVHTAHSSCNRQGHDFKPKDNTESCVESGDEGQNQVKEDGWMQIDEAPTQPAITQALIYSLVFQLYCLMAQPTPSTPHEPELEHSLSLVRQQQLTVGLDLQSLGPISLSKSRSLVASSGGVPKVRNNLLRRQRRTTPNMSNNNFQQDSSSSSSQQANSSINAFAAAFVGHKDFKPGQIYGHTEYQDGASSMQGNVVGPSLKEYKSNVYTSTTINKSSGFHLQGDMGEELYLQMAGKPKEQNRTLTDQRLGSEAEVRRISPGSNVYSLANK